MSSLDIVLRYTPSYWQRHSYQNTLYIKVDINKQTEEYRTVDNIVHNTFGNITIYKIERIQHPFAYGRFHIRKQQLTLINKREPTVNRVILSITDQSKLDSIVHYNCDSRRGGFSERHLLRSNGFMLMIKTLDQFPCERDSNRYPEYLIAYRQIQWPPSNTLTSPSLRPVPSTMRLTSSASLTKVDSRSSQPTTTTSSYKDNTKTLQSNYDYYDYRNDNPWRYPTRDNLPPYLSTEPSSGWIGRWLWIGAAVIGAYIYWRRSAK